MKTSLERPASIAEPVAVIGMACRFPGASSPEAFWELQAGGRDAITRVPPERFDLARCYDQNLAAGKMNTCFGGFLDQVDGFDPDFFGISPREATRMDPQQRLLMEVGWEALESAGIPPRSLAGSPGGVFVGISSHDYLQIQLRRSDLLDAHSGTGNSPSIAANRLSYFLDLRGPSLAVDTACSSSLVAVHLAVESLRRGECSLALAGGVNVILNPESTIIFSQARMLSPDGRCKTFDARADGYVRGEGCGVVVLQRLETAVECGAKVRAVIRGSAVNQDGRSNGLTAPNGPSQREVIRQALRNGGVAARDIGYVEAHGTGTPLGDPIEVKALIQALGKDRPPDCKCVIGSVKTNVGHLEAAAGIAGLIKVILVMEHGEVPPHLHLERLNPQLRLEISFLEVATATRPWPSSPAPRFAGVSSFGFGGTNAHVVLESAPPSSGPALPTEGSGEGRAGILALSARSGPALVDLARLYAAFLEREPLPSLGDLCSTANLGREHFPHRLAIVGRSHEELRDRLRGFLAGERFPGIAAGRARLRRPPKPVFLLGGLNSLDPAAAAELHRTEPVFARALDHHDALVQDTIGHDALAALAAFQSALAEWWRSFGILPSLVVGCGENGSQEVSDMVQQIREHAADVVIVLGARDERVEEAMRLLPPGSCLWLTSADREGGGRRTLLEGLARLYADGADVEWAALHAGSRRQVVSLPTYPFQRVRCWVEATEMAATGSPATDSTGKVLVRANHPLLGSRVRAPLREHLYESRIGDGTPGFLEDHRVGEQTVVPGAFHVALGLAAARERFGDDACLLEDVTFQRALVLPEATFRTVELVLRPEKKGFSFAVHGLEPEAEEESEWTLHASGRLRRAPDLPRGGLESLDPIRERCREQWPADDFYRRLEERGLRLGPAFRWIEHVWRRPGEALCRLRPPRPAERDLAPLHPGLIDSCFQALAATVDAAAADAGAYLPLLLESFQGGGLVEGPSWCHVVQRSDGGRGSTTVIGDLRLCDEHGRSLAEVKGLAVRPAALEALSPVLSAESGEERLQIEWRPMSPDPSRADAEAGPALPHPQWIAANVSCPREIQGLLETHNRLLPAWDALCATHVEHALRQLGWRPRPGETVNVPGLAGHLGIQVRHRRLLDRFLGILAEDGVLAEHPSGWEVRLPLARTLDGQLGGLQARFPEFRSELELTDRCGRSLAAVLSGACDPLDLLFPGGSLRIADDVFREAPFARTFNAWVRDLVALVASRRGRGRPLRILEVGGGSGGTTAAVLPVLLPEATRYTFTDVSPLFLSKASERFAAYPFVRYGQLDLDDDPAGQGFGAESFDVVIAANVLHATRHLRRSLDHLRRLLAEGGLLIGLECTGKARWLDLVFGLLEGWWRFEDFDLRPRHPLLSAGGWLEPLGRAGFAGPTILNGAPGLDAPHALILARAGVATPGETEAAPVAQGTWWIFADTGGLGMDLARRLRELGGTVQLVRPAGREATPEPSVIVDPSSPEDCTRLVAGMSREAAGLARGVVYLWGLDATDPAEMPPPGSAFQAAWPVAGALHLIQALALARHRDLPKVWIATRGAQPVGEVRPLALAQTPLWGLGRVIALEHAELWGGLVDLDPAAPTAEAEALVDAVLTSPGAGDRACRDGSVYVPRLARRAAPVRGAPPAALRADGTYLIAGGLGGLGLIVARWMAARGARHLLLVGRRGPSDEVQRTLGGLREAGVKIICEQADVAIASEIDEVLSRTRETMPPLRGVIHAAGVLRDRLVVQMDWESFATVLAAKVQGAWNLHRATEDRALDFFVLFSSAASLIGSPGQANHAAACAFLDGLAHHRRSLGRPALSINWGPWRETGAAAGERVHAHLDPWGIRGLATAAGLRALDDLIQDEAPQAGVLHISWARFAARFPGGRPPPLASLVVPELPEPSDDQDPHERRGHLRRELAATASGRRRQVLEDRVGEALARVLRRNPGDRAGMDRPLMDLGLDSLMALDLRRELEEILDTRLPATLAFDHGTARALVDFLAEKVIDEGEAARADDHPAGAGNGLERIVDRVATLSERELEGAIAKELEALMEGGREPAP